VLDVRLQQPLAQVPNGRAKRQGIAVGEAVVWPITCSATTCRLAEHTIRAAQRPRCDDMRGAQMTTSRRRIVVDRRRRRANARPTRRQPAAVDGGKEFAEAVFGPPPTGSRFSRSASPSVSHESDRHCAT
jgi:hypothetical protein